MAGIVDFDAKSLSELVLAHGIDVAWKRLLVTHLTAVSGFDDILKSPQFSKQSPLDENLLEGLSVGEISVLYEYSVALSDPNSRKDNGQFFTPDDVADFMARYSSEFPSGVWLDPCSGVGNLSWHLAASQPDPEQFAINRLIVSDRDALALLIARTLFAISFQNREQNLFSKLEKNFILFDFLSVSDQSHLLMSDPLAGLEQIPKHDFVIVNPPYLALKKSDTKFETAQAADLYAYFLENIVKTSAGFISVTPQSFTNASKFRTLRALLLRSYENLTILNFDNIPGNLFRGIKFGSTNSNTANSIRAAIMVALPGKGKPKITSLFRWRTSERERLFREIGAFASDVELTEEYFPKVSNIFQDLYEATRSSKTLATMLSNKATGFPLYVPSAPRYFISALLQPVQRSSLRTLYFRNQEDREAAYLLLNSSFMYWWWRVRDGGMTLSLETLTSLPFIDFKIDRKLIGKLKVSESINKVYKLNSGSQQENVKHDLKLIAKINECVAPAFADRLIRTHQNSEFDQIT